MVLIEKERVKEIDSLIDDSVKKGEA